MDLNRLDQAKIRNFCIIAHIDHGKSTLADRFLDLTHTISEREKRDQILDSMDLEVERGITIKMKPVTMYWEDYVLNLIDTPGHVDFSYEVSRALAAVEGAILLVDATQGIQAQTLANLYLAMEQNIVLIPVINKIDLPAANPAAVSEELATLLQIAPEDILTVSAKTGINVADVLKSVVERVPPPRVSQPAELTKALIFDSYYDKHRGVVCDVRIFQGSLKRGSKIFFYQTNTWSEAKEVGIYRPSHLQTEVLVSGQIGYLITGIREMNRCRVGDTVIGVAAVQDHLRDAVKALPGYKKIKPMVFANIYPRDQSRYLELRRSLEELKLNDSSLEFQPAALSTLGQGFQIGVLGLLHLDIIKERLRREYGLDLVLTVPQVEYHLKVTNKKSKLKTVEGEDLCIVTSPQEFPDYSSTEQCFEPWVKLEIITPQETIGGIMSLVIERRGEYLNTEYIVSQATGAGGSTAGRALLFFHLPLAELLTDFYDKLKSISSGYASLNYDFADWRPVDLVKMEFLVADEMLEALSGLVPRSQAYGRAGGVLKALKEEIPPHLFEIRLQAQLGGKIIASERIKPMRKNVTAGLYGGDVTRKMKLLKKQKEGKKRLKSMGRVEIPTDAYLAVLKR